MKRLLLAALIACSDPPEPAWKLQRPRVLAFDAASVSDPTRTSFTAGERVQIALTSSSAATSRGAFPTHAFRVCPAELNPAILGCGGPDIAFDVTTDRDPAIRFTAPNAPVYVFGVVCQDAPFVAPNELKGSCAGGGQEVSLRLVPGEPENHRPAFDEASARIDGRPLLATDDCTGATFAANAGEHTIEIRPTSIEPGDDPVIEHVVTFGDLEQLYTVPDADGIARIKWTAPSSLDGDRLPVRFELVLRDGRGGTAFLTRMLCLSKGS